MLTSIEDKDNSLVWLKEVYAVLSKLDWDKKEFEEATQNTKVVEILLKTNNHYKNWDSFDKLTISLDATDILVPSLHPILKWLNIAQAHKAILEDLSESIRNIRAKANRAKFCSCIHVLWKNNLWRMSILYDASIISS